MTTDAHKTKLQAVLRKEGRKQSWLARETRIHESWLSRIVTGEIHAGAPHRQKIAAALGRPESDLFEDR